MGPTASSASVSIQVAFSENVTVTGTPTLALNSGGTASYTCGSGTSTLTFSYTVAAGHGAADLDYTSNGALSLSGGTIQDGATNTGDVDAGVARQPAGSLEANKDLVIDTAPHTCTWTGTTNTTWATATNWTNCANVAPQSGGRSRHPGDDEQAQLLDRHRQPGLGHRQQHRDRTHNQRRHHERQRQRDDQQRRRAHDDSGSLNVAGDFSNAGTLNGTGGTITYNGASAQAVARPAPTPRSCSRAPVPNLQHRDGNGRLPR